MRIFFLVTKSEVGGAQTYLWQIINYFFQKGNDVALMAYPGGWLEEKVRNLGVKFYPNEYFLNTPCFSWLKAIKKIKKAIEDFNPELVSCHSTVAGFLGRLTIKNKIPTIFTAHGWGFACGTPFLRKYFVLLAEKLAANFSKKIICVSQSDKDLALKYKIAPLEKLRVVHNGVEIDQQILDSKFKILNSKFKIVFVGRLAEPKDPILLLDAFNDLTLDLQERAEILIVGGGKKRKEIEDFSKEKKLANKVRILGQLSWEKTLEILKECQIFVLISNWEGFPISVLEAMSLGLAIIASDVGGIREAVDENCGILVKKGDKVGVKNALEKLLKNPSIILSMGKNAQQRVKENFSLEKMLKETEGVYKTVLLGN